MQALAYNSKANAYMLHKVAVRARYEGLSETSDEVLSFDAQPLWLSPSEDFKAGRGLPLILDVFCLVVLSLCVLNDVFQSCWRCLQRKSRTCLFWDVTGTRCLNWTIVFLCAFIVCHYAYAVSLVHGLRLMVQALPIINNNGPYGSGALNIALSSAGSSLNQYQHSLNVVVEQSCRIVQAQFDLRCCCVLLVLMMCLHCILGLHKVPQLRVVMHTLLCSAGELLHVFVLLGGVVITLATTGYAIHGCRLEAFCTWSGSMASVLLLIVGQVTDKLTEDTSNTLSFASIAWMWLANITMQCLMLCASVTVVVSVYLNAKSSLEHTKFVASGT